MKIETKFEYNTTYYAICKIYKDITCPQCNGHYEKQIEQDGFKGKIVCSNCRFGRKETSYYKIIPFTIQFCSWDNNGMPIDAHLEIEKSDFDELLGSWDNDIYVNDAFDYRSDWYVTIKKNTKLNNIFATKSEAEQALKRLEGEDE